MTEKIDPVTLEIFQSRLKRVAFEAGIVLQKTAASHVAVDAKDFGFNIADKDGRSVIYSIWGARHGTTTAYLVKSVLKNAAGLHISPGDMFFVNNPHDGALHILDVAIVAPFFYQGEIMAWTGCAMHHIDIGAAVPGWNPTASDWFSEGIKIPPVKIVSGGDLREDVFNLFLANVRMPDSQGLDLKAQIAATHSAHQKLSEIFELYGQEAVQKYCDTILDLTEQKARERIKLLPEGTYRFSDYLDFDDVYEIRCAMTVANDTITFDFAGTGTQAPFMINSALPCTVASLHNTIVCALMPDIEANEGLFRPIQVHAPRGCIVNCDVPAACSGSSTTSGWKVQSVVLGCLSQAFIQDPAWADRATAAWGGGHVSLQLSGTDQYGRRFTMHPMEGTMQGGGARANSDGEDVTNVVASTYTSIPNVETYEQRFPILFLHRRLAKDSGGPGKHRGGLSGEFAFTPHKTDRLSLVSYHIGHDVPPWGFAEGKPAGKSQITITRNSNVRMRLQEVIPEVKEIEGQVDDLPPQCASAIINAGDVLYARCPGGGGFGNPLERQIEHVVRDVQDNKVSREKSETEYGVILNEKLEVNYDKTLTLRKRGRDCDRAALEEQERENARFT